MVYESGSQRFGGEQVKMTGRGLRENSPIREVWATLDIMENEGRKQNG